MNAQTKKKLENMTEAERKVYNAERLEYRKTLEFFTVTATKRVNKTLSAMRTLGFMGNYNGTDEQKDAIIEAIDTAVVELKNSIYKHTKEKTSFNFA